MTSNVIRVGGYAPAESPHSHALDRFADFIRQESDGSVEVDVLHNVMDLGRPAADLFDMMITGELTMCYFSTSYLGSAVPVVNALEIPYLFGSLDAAHEALDGRFGNAVSNAIQDVYGVEVMGYWDNGFRHLTNALRPLRSPVDCSGLSIRLQPNHIHEALTAAWGMTPVPCELSVGIQMIANGEVDAQENPLANTAAYGVTHQYITLTSHLYGARGVFANADQLSTLGPAVADLTRRAARVAIDSQRKEARLYEITLRQQFEAEGRTVVDLSDEQRGAFVEAAGSVMFDARCSIPAEVLEFLA